MSFGSLLLTLLNEQIPTNFKCWNLLKSTYEQAPQLLYLNTWKIMPASNDPVKRPWCSFIMNTVFIFLWGLIPFFFPQKNCLNDSYSQCGLYNIWRSILRLKGLKWKLCLFFGGGGTSQGLEHHFYARGSSPLQPVVKNLRDANPPYLIGRLPIL